LPGQSRIVPAFFVLSLIKKIRIMKKVIGIGNALVDVLVKLQNDSFLEQQKIPKGSMQLSDKETVMALLVELGNTKIQLTSGGSAANTIHGLAKLGTKCSYIGKIGKDDFGSLFKNDLEKNHISTILLSSNTDTGRALTFISPDSERTFATYLGAAVELNADDLKTEYFEGYSILHLEGYLIFNNELVKKAVELAKSKGLKISLDLASYNVVDANKEFLHKLIKDSIDIVFANEEESKSLTGEGPEKALDIISQLCDIAVVKVGSKGSMVKAGEKIYKVDAIKATAIDTTGAGDLFASGFLHGYCKGWTLDKCAELGSLTAGKVVETIGAKISQQVWDEIKVKMNA
jgi:sugar/nucleoside kinase (ribokinase family)